MRDDTPNSFSAHCALSKRGCVIELAPWDFATECISGGFHPEFVIHSVICNYVSHFFVRFFNFTPSKFVFHSVLAIASLHVVLRPREGVL